MLSEYFVMYQRDRNVGKNDINKPMVFDKCEEFNSLEEATAFGVENLHDRAIVAKTIKSAADYDAKATYVVAAYYDRKYFHHCYDGSSDPVATHEVFRTSLKGLESVVERMAKENPKKMYLGIEQKLIPSPLDYRHRGDDI